MRKIFMSLTSKLCFYILLLTTIIFLCIAFVFNSYSVNREETQAELYTSALLQNMVQKIDRKLADVERSVIETAPIVEKNLHRPDSMMGIIKDMVWNNSTILGGCVAFEPNFYKGKRRLFMEYVSLDSLDNIEYKHLGGDSYNYLYMQWYTEAKKQKQGIWSEPYFDKNGGNEMMTTFTLPLLDKAGNVYAVITADVSLETLVDDINAIRPYPDSYSFVLSKKGAYLAHPDKFVIQNNTYLTRADDIDQKELIPIGKKMIKGEKGAARLEIANTDVLACYTPILRTGWSVCCICPYKTIMNNLGSTALTIVVILLAGLILLIICIRIILIHSTKPISELANAAYSIALGKFDTQLPEIDTKDEMKKLHDAFAHMQESLKEYIEKLTETTRTKERIQSELHIAKKIQMSMIPQIFSPFPEWDDLELHAMLQPAKEVSGDFYDFFIRDEKLFFTIGDVSGKGIPASLVMATTRTLFRIMSGKYNSPASIATMLNNAIAEKNEANMFITMYIGVLNLNNGKLTYCNAGHNAPMTIAADGTATMLDVKPNLPIGIVSDFKFFDQQTTLEDSMAMILYTDGLTEAENKEKELYGEETMKNFGKKYSSLEAKDIIEDLYKQVIEFADGAEQSDDLTLMCLRYHTPSKHNCMQVKKELIISNNIEESSKLYPFLKELWEELPENCSEEMFNSVNLALEEALVNSIQYAYANENEGEIILTECWNKETETLEFVLKDSGTPFDPTKHEEADVTSPLMERPIGGLGIFLVKQIMDKVEYEYKDGSNILTMTKNIGSATETAI